MLPSVRKMMETFFLFIFWIIVKRLLGPMESLAPWGQSWKEVITYEYICIWCYLLFEYMERASKMTGTFFVMNVMLPSVRKMMETYFLYHLDNREAFPGAYESLAPWRQSWKEPIIYEYIWMWCYLLYEYMERASKMMEKMLLCMWCYLLYENWWNLFF